ncbi:MAG: hypothetical protein SFY66_10540 [Oculatellaceae cyanobacterium bins.114]|nr:hypothetical protein [Oculatellaceae cyanobacterium bins.114]
MLSYPRWFATLTVVALMQLINSGVAVAQSSSAAPIANPTHATPPAGNSGAPPNPTLRSSPQMTEPSQPQSTPLSQETVTPCAAGQFLSVFSDVRPDHWAYEAVNRLAVGEPRCFPLTPQS